MFRKLSRRLAFIFLLIFGSFVILLGLLVLAVGLAITHHDDFHDRTAIKEEVEPEIDYVQYWIGLPYVVTGVSVACSAVNLRRVSLTACTLTLSIASIVLSLAGLLVDGPDWVKWKNYGALESYWERKDGYACISKENTCSCVGKTNTTTITPFADCKTVRNLASIYGILISCFAIVLALLLASITFIVYVITSNEEKRLAEGRGRVTEVFRVNGSSRRYKESAPISRENRGYQREKQSNMSKEGESVSHQNKDDSVANGEVMMMDPGHFQLGDDDIY